MMKGTQRLWTVLAAVGFVTTCSYAVQNLLVVTGDWRQNNIVEYTPDGEMVRSFQASLPSEYQMDGLGELRWGSNGHLFVYGSLNDGVNDWREGVFEWTRTGSLVGFTQRNPAGNMTQGFDVLDNGNFVTVDLLDSGQKVKEWDSSFTTPTIYGNVQDPEGDQGAIHSGKWLYVVGGGALVKYDTETDEWVSGVGTLRDNSLIDLSNDGRIALNDQWTGGDVGILDKAQIEIYGVDMNLLGTAILPESYCITKGLAFDDAGLLYVTAAHAFLSDNGTPDDPTDDFFDRWNSEVYVFDQSYNYVRMFELKDGAGYVGDLTLAQPVPGPAGAIPLGFGFLAMLARRRRNRQR